ncbi:MAG: GNAT family N-acetyltransferase, partial [Solirubrobacterales bacterium]|nr:GNAT family N-acetyltransferase [Solirubrobacterales bacterium]
MSAPEIRIDPLTGLRAIVAGARADRPGGELRATPAPELDPAEDPFAEGELVGTCRLVMVGSTAQFSRLAVRADARRQGVATSLLREADRE